MIDLTHLPEKAKKAEKETQAFFKNLKKSKWRGLDDVVHQIHKEVFTGIDCLECGNCCRTLGPMVSLKDIDRIAKKLRRKPADVINEFLKVDEDNDYVFKSMPCPFNGEDNYCSIYEDRPKACREYPHTDRKKFYQIYALTIRNAQTCPAVYNILEKLKQR